MHRNRTKACVAAALLTMVAGAGSGPAASAAQREPAGPAFQAAGPAAHQLRVAGPAAHQLRAAGPAAHQLRAAGPAAHQLRAAGQRPAAPALQTVRLGGSSRATRPFSLLGVTWAEPGARVTGVVRVRTRTIATGQWSAWRELETDGRAPADIRGSSDPLWVGPSDGVETRTSGTLPAGMRVDLINPDAQHPAPRRAGAAKAPATTATESPRRAEKARAVVPLPARPIPRTVTRTGWRANEAIVRAAPEYTGPTQVFFVHHTATGNGYTCSQSASIVRGIQAYQVRSRGWDDIGYNFLVDKCGTVFEGRVGGIGRTVLGAHTLGFNTDASSIAVIGDHGAYGVTPRVRTVIAAMAAYKLGAYGNPPNGRVVLTSGGSDRFPLGQKVPFFRISGHRDAGRTACPGNALYAQLPSIRAIAGAAPAGLRILSVRGAGRLGSLYFTKNAVQPIWSVTTPSALISRYEIWVDGVLRTATPAGRRSAAVSLAPGIHSVTVRALHLSGRSTTVSTRVVADATLPVFTQRPELALRPGTVRASEVPMHLDWNVTDGVALGSVGLVRPSAVNLGVGVRTRNLAAPANRPAVFTVRAIDRSGNAADASVTRTPWVLSDLAAQRRGSWRVLRNPGYLGGTALVSSVRGASASWRFTGRSVGLVLSKGPKAGRVGVFFDGRPQGMVDLRAATAQPRRIVWTKWVPQGGAHTVRVVAEGGKGIALDALVHLK
ncbi:N-acetylmuramoyl-L-alanine amidase [Actinoplanes solisilvae]|uniref:N-acetylmuramoyl-L-alanine amidase n=1 Tax=Actinoplanes solisilvae TaxID=2486853 RepID=UPI001F0C31D2|nr:N-acetylmuramoyl-L-alanine amidase [Actinoplanes solisilvae]